MSKAKPTIGHNKPPPDDNADDVGGVSGKRLRSFIERIERLESEKAGIAEDIKEVYAEAKGTGFEPKIMRKIIRERKMDPDKRREEEELLDIYRGALGMLIDTPLGAAAVIAKNLRDMGAEIIPPGDGK